jgi:hypothetical protein
MGQTYAFLKDVYLKALIPPLGSGTYMFMLMILIFISDDLE